MGEIIRKGQTNVSPKKPYESNVWQCPIDITQDFWVKLSLPIDDFQKPDLVMSCKSWISDDNVTWNPYHGATFAGGVKVDKGGNLATSFAFSCRADRVAGKYVKAIMESSIRVKVTMIVETID